VSPLTEEVEANLRRSEESLDAARELLDNGHYDFSASRSYYAVFYAANALLLSQDISRSKHSGTISAFHRYFVKTDEVPKECGKIIGDLFELRGIADYGGTEHVGSEAARDAIEKAERFVRTVRDHF
jgi:uncharacterized protein (UPF0332 family)